MANNRAEIYFFNHYCINIVQTIFFLSVLNSFVMGGIVLNVILTGKGRRAKRGEKRSTCGIDWHLRVLFGRNRDGK